MERLQETVGAFEAKTRLSELLEQVGRGRSFVITKHDRPVARLVSYSAHLADLRAGVPEQLRELRRGCSLGGASIFGLRDEGRP